MSKRVEWWYGLPGFEDVTDEELSEDHSARFKEHLKALEREKAARIKHGVGERGVYEATTSEAQRSIEDGLETGWETIDDSLGRPFLPGEVVVLGARTGVGKTWVAQHLSEKAMANEHHRVAFLSIEMSYYQLGERFAAHALGVNPNEAMRMIREGEVTVDELVEHTPGKGRWWFYERSVGVEEIKDVVESAAELMGAPPTILVIDYLGLLAGKGKLYERTSDNARALKEAAKETNTIILACAQISRQDGGSGEQEPTLAGMRDSGAIEEAADRVLLFWGVKDSKSEIMCRIAKNRYGGKSDPVRLKFDDVMQLREYVDMYKIGDHIPF